MGCVQREKIACPSFYKLFLVGERMSRYTPQSYGTVNIGVQTIQGKERPDPKYQELDINPNEFVSQKNKPSPQKTQVHEQIKELIAYHNIPRRQAVKIALANARESKSGDTGTITPKQIYRHKFQAEQPGRQMSPFRTQEQNFPFI